MKSIDLNTATQERLRLLIGEKQRIEQMIDLCLNTIIDVKGLKGKEIELSRDLKAINIK